MLARPKFGFPHDEIAALLAMLRDQGELIRPEGLAPALPDPDDEKFLHCAIAGQADYIITGNARDFPQESSSLRVVSAGELLDHITREI